MPLLGFSMVEKKGDLPGTSAAVCTWSLQVVFLVGIRLLLLFFAKNTICHSPQGSFVIEGIESFSEVLLAFALVINLYSGHDEIVWPS